MSGTAPFAPTDRRSSTEIGYPMVWSSLADSGDPHSATRERTGQPAQTDRRPSSHGRDCYGARASTSRGESPILCGAVGIAVPRMSTAMKSRLFGDR